MSAPAMRPATQPAWEDEGRRVTERLHDVAAVVVMGRDPSRAARVAVGIALAECARRQVVLADLVGDLEPLYALAGGEDAVGLTDCFHEGLPLNDIARRALSGDAIFVLPAGSPPVATRAVLAHDRWPKLVRGFTEAGALLVLVAPLGAPGVEVLVGAAQGVVVVDTPPAAVRAFTVLATVDAPEPPAVPTTARGARGGRRTWMGVAALFAIALAGAGGWYAWSRRGARPPERPALTVPRAPPRAAVAPPVAADTIRLGDPVNTSDSASAAPFAVEVVAANTVSGANSVIRDGVAAGTLPAPTVSPVVLGGSTVWYKAIVGAWHGRSGADSLLAALRARGTLRSGAGVVVRVPFALLLADGVSRDSADALVRGWVGRGVGAYGLLQDDGRVRVFAGAFETPSQAAPLAASVRDAGTAPVMAIRTGRSY
ncbi:MAG: hypothetical protein HY084_09610 [Gemmatimonadetes bacterium]|nr:hypothetical protein [Gemmatimonadota bacterium]